MGKCFASTCRHRSERDTCKFLRFPKSPRKRNKWLLALNREDGKEPSSSAYLCSCHFPSGSRLRTPDFRKSPKTKPTQTPSQPVDQPSPRRNTSKPSARRMLMLDMGEEEVASVGTPKKSESSLSLEDSGLCTSVGGSPWQVSDILLTPSILYEKETLQEEIVKITAERDKIKSVIHSATSELEVLRKELSSSQAKTSAANQEFAMCALEKIDFALRLKDTEMQLSDSEKQKQILEVHKQKLSQELRRVQNLLDISERDCCRFKTENGKLTSLNSSLSANLSEVKSELVNTKENLEVMLKVSSVLKHEKSQLANELNLLKCKFSFSVFCTDSNISHYTGLANKNTFYWLLSMIPENLIYYYGSKVNCVCREDQLFLTLLKLRKNITHDMLRDMFHISVFTVTNIFVTWVSALHTVIFRSFMREIPSLRKVQKSMPKAFEKYPNCRIIIDCTEMEVEVPGLMSKHNLVHSNYKKRSTFKSLVGIAPNGTMVYCSKLFPGSTSDNKIVEETGVLQNLVAGDCVMADKGFTINKLLPPGVTLNIPPFKKTPQFTHGQIIETLQIAQSRIHVERAIQRIKIYEILDYIPHSLFSHATEIFQVCAALTNFGMPLIKEVEALMRVNF